MKILVTADYEAMSRKAEQMVEAFLQEDPRALVSFPGGDTPARLLELFVAAVQEERVDPAQLRFVQLDDWVGIGPQDAGSCSHFLRTKLLEPMGRPFGQQFLFDASRTDIDAQVAAQDAFIRRWGPIGVEVLGIGMNGHLGFNEEGVDFSLRSHRNPLSNVTRGVQKKYFGGRDLPLTEGVTQGIAQIMESRLVILLANGEKKAEIMEQALTGPVTNRVPASVLQTHPNAVCILDRAAAARLPRDLPGLEFC